MGKFFKSKWFFLAIGVIAALAMNDTLKPKFDELMAKIKGMGGADTKE